MKDQDAESRNQLIGEFLIFVGLEMLAVLVVAYFCGTLYELWKMF